MERSGHLLSKNKGRKEKNGRKERKKISDVTFKFLGERRKCVRGGAGWRGKGRARGGGGETSGVVN